MEETKIMTSGNAWSKSHLCSVVSKATREEPAGCGTPFVGYLGIEVAPPWKHDITESSRFPEGLRKAVERAQDAGVIGKFTTLFPDPVYSREGYVRALYLHKPPGPFVAYEKREYAVPEGEIVPLVEALAEGLDGLSCFQRYEEDTSRVRDILVCTHGSHDACCGKFGYPVYATLRYGYAAASEGQLRVWRTSHIGGHRFAPTLIDFPEGRYWGHLEPEAIEKLVLRKGPVSGLRQFYRGWAGLSGKFEQIAEREIFAREGWGWTRYLKSGKTLKADQNEDRAEVRIEYATSGGNAGAYEATVEANGTVMTLCNSGPEPLQEVKQYRVSRLEKKVPLGRR
jgi:hypothetical protein